MATEAPGTTEHAVGMPQLDVTTWPNQIFWLLITLVAIYFIVSRVALPRIGGVLAERSGLITNDLAAAEALKQQAVAAETAYTEALARARGEAAKIVAQAKAEIQAELDSSAAHANAEIAARAAESEVRIGEIRAGALVAVRDVARETAGALVSALGGQVDAEAVSEAVTARTEG